MSAIGRDPDLKRFTRELQHTDPGIRFRRAWLAMLQAHKQCQIQCRLERGTLEQSMLLYYWRRKLIAESEEASSILAELVEKFGWPAESGRAASFRWRPTAARPPRSGP